MPFALRSALPLLIAVLAYGLVLARGAGLLLDGDTYWHIATGTWILQHLAVPHRDPFSFTAAGTPWLDHEWLAEVLMALAWRAGGWSGLVLVTVLALAAALGLLCRRLLRWLPPGPAAVLVLLAYCTVAPGLLCRPHVLALPLLVGWAAELVAARAGGRAPHWSMVPLMALWANLHGSFLIGLVLLVPLGLEAVLTERADRRRMALGWGEFTLAAVLAACSTPYLLAGLLRPLQVMRMSVSLATISEWRSPDFQQLQPLEIWLMAALVVVLSRGIRLPPARLIIGLALLHAGLQHARNQILLGLIGPLVLAEPLSVYFGSPARWPQCLLGRFAPPLRAGAAIAAIVLTAAFAAHPLERTTDRATPSAALDRVPAMLAVRPVLNDYDFGGYLIFRGIRPYIDGRADMYGDAFVAAYLDVLRPDKPKLEAALRNRAIVWTLLHPDDGAVAVLDALPGWHRLYADEVAVVHARSDPPPSGIAAVVP